MKTNQWLCVCLLICMAGIGVGFSAALFWDVTRVTMQDVERAMRKCTIVEEIWHYGFSCKEPKGVMNDDYLN